jgi:ribosomal protein S18 acetylase RimI-like enzyme
MSDTVQIRAARPEDAEVIADFNARMARETEGHAPDATTLAAGVRAALADPSKARYFVAEIDGRVAAQLMITLEWSDWRNGDIWWIQSVYVDPQFRRRGAFRALYRHVAQLARERGAVGLRLYVEKENAAAQRTYAELGMQMTHYLVMEEMFGGAGKLTS